MKCLICDSQSEYYFSKTYTESPFDEFMREIGTVDYYKCGHCGFVISKTHCQLERNVWHGLNHKFHHYLETPSISQKINQPPYIEQAVMLNLLSSCGIIDSRSMIDYAAGFGALSNILEKYFGLSLAIFDPYVQSVHNINRYVEAKALDKYQVVMNSAMFEHVLSREDLDHVNKIVDIDGCLIIHTVVCERIPNDPEWFYLQPPVHTAFHTNQSMEILMKQWGYRSSLYCPQSKSWVLLRREIETVAERIATLNRDLNATWFHCKNGFVDYWKGF